MKTCTKCKECKKENAFYKRKNGLSYVCKECSSIYRTTNYYKYKESHDVERKRAKGTIQFRYQRLKSAAKSRHIILNLTMEEYKNILKMPCHYCNNLLCVPVTSGVGLDRLDSNLSYCINNCVSCCTFCNTVKSDLLTETEMLKIVQLLIAERKDAPPINVHELRLKFKSENIIDVQQMIELEDNKCIDCNKIISSLAKRCRSCAHKK
jgi:hypothetical protein